MAKAGAAGAGGSLPLAGGSHTPQRVGANIRVLGWGQQGLGRQRGRKLVGVREAGPRWKSGKGTPETSRGQFPTGAPAWAMPTPPCPLQDDLRCLSYSGMLRRRVLGGK